MTNTEPLDLLSRHRLIWQRKPELQRIYRDEFFNRLLAEHRPGGISVEVGSGPGFFKETFAELIATDMMVTPWVNAVVDAQHMAFKTNSVSNVFGLDVLHHFESPLIFLKEVQRVLVSGGRLILIEPWVTPFSYVLYRYFHQEDCDLSVNPLRGSAIRYDGEKKLFDGNQAIPYLLFRDHAVKETIAALPQLAVKVIEPFCLFAYLLSGGFKPASLLPRNLYPLVAAFERITRPLWQSIGALRVLIVLERL